MKILFYFLPFVVLALGLNCKKCPECEECPKKAITTTDHYYKIYKGSINTSINSRTTSHIGSCDFTISGNTYYRKYFMNSRVSDLMNTKLEYDFYYLTFSTTRRAGFQDTFLLLKNDSLELNTYDDHKHPPAGTESKGTLGCFPQFILVNGQLDYFDVNSGGNMRRYIQLPFGYHQEGQHVIQVLNSLDYEISVSDYNLLNGYLQINPNLQGGIDIGSPNILKLYYANGDDTGIRFPS